MVDTPLIVPHDVLYDFIVKLYLASGLSEHHANLAAKMNVETSLRGVETHGVRHVSHIVGGVKSGRIKPRPNLRPVKQLGALEVWDGDSGPPEAIAAVAMERAIELAKEKALGWVMIRGSSHYGASGSYATMAAEAGLVGLALSDSGPSMAVHGARVRSIGNNPLAFAAPPALSGTMTFPLLVDIAVSAISGLKVMYMIRNGEPLPKGWVVPGTEIDGGWVLLPAGGPKGSGLGIIIEILTSVLSGGGILSDLNSREKDHGVGQWSHTQIAMDPFRLMSREEYDRSLNAMADSVKSATKAPGVDEILIPGERAWRETQRQKVEGVTIDAVTRESMERAAGMVGHAVPW